MTRTLSLLAVLLLVSSATAFSLKQTEMTDACLMDISKIATAIPKIIDDIKRQDMISLMTDIMNTIPLFNQTRNDCSGFHPDDMVNQTTKNNLMYCSKSFLPIFDSLEVVFNDIIHGKFTEVYDHVLLVLSNAAYSMRVCANLAEFIEYPKKIFNWFNSTQCWNAHQRSANLLHTIMHDLQVGNYTDALNLTLPFISASADSFRFCSVNLSRFDLATIDVPTSYSNLQYTSYSFIELDEIDEVQAKKDECKVNLAEIIQALSSEPQNLGKTLNILPKLKGCAEAIDIAKLIKSPVVAKIVSVSMAKTFN